ncbi:MAG: PrsW family intramembrane metalloprotease [Oscillospiraceae bacterium]|nr:PrsW family intramembrane metalloprotease [Oscillospiraceae bacterium]
MFYFLLPALASYNFVLILAAVVPAALLMIKAYRSDRLEKEPTGLLWQLAKAGVLSSLIALVAERVLCWLLDLALPQELALYNVILYFGIVAFSEEGAKYFMLKRSTWRTPAFNCQYDGVVYAVFVSLGFALWENISYVMAYGVSTAIVRAVTAIPGHACFGVFMGVFYGAAKKHDNRKNQSASKAFRVLSVLIPAIGHGAYDYIASVEQSTWYFVIFIAVLFAVSYYLVHRTARRDQYI